MNGNGVTEAIVGLVADERELIEKNLVTIFARTARDLIAGGVAADKVTAALFGVGLVHKLKEGERETLKTITLLLCGEFGPEKTAALLRESAARADAMVSMEAKLH